MERLIAIGVASLLAACSSSDIGPGDSEYGAGSLGNGGFAYVCDASVVCGQNNAADPFPSAVSLGGKFTVRYVPRTSNQSDAVGVTIATVGDEYLTAAVGNAFVAKTAGVGTLLALDAKGSVVDFQTVKIAKPDALGIFVDDVAVAGDTSISLGTTRTFRAVARASGEALAGALGYEWSADRSDVVQVLANGTNGNAVVNARAAGTATITVTGGTFTQTIRVTVQ